MDASGDSNNFNLENEMMDVKLSLSAIDQATSHLDDSIPLPTEVCVCCLAHVQISRLTHLSQSFVITANSRSKVQCLDFHNSMGVWQA